MYVTGLKCDEAVKGNCFSWLLRLEDEKEIGIQQGIQQGRQEGRMEGRMETARNMKAKNCDVSFIVEITGLKREEIEKL